MTAIGQLCAHTCCCGLLERDGGSVSPQLRRKKDHRDAWSREVLAQPAEPATDEPVVMPPSSHYLSAKVAKLVASERRGPAFPFVLHLPGPLMYEVGAPQAEVHFGVVTQFDHPLGDVADVATPTLNVPAIV